MIQISSFEGFWMLDNLFTFFIPSNTHILSVRSFYRQHAPNNQYCLVDSFVCVEVCRLDSTEIVYATFHSDVGETPFFIGVDFDKARIVISIRGTLSMQVGWRSKFLLIYKHICMYYIYIYYT